jgi:hypothetical protein
MSLTDFGCARMRREISESAHGGTWPDGQLAEHLRGCADCRAAWEGQQDLARHLAVLRRERLALRPATERRAALMREFEARHRKSPVQRWTWAVAMAAGLVLMAGVAPRVWDGWQARGGAVAETAEAGLDGDGQEGFIAVPYAPAVAPGESLRVVRTELYPAALASLGVDMDPAWTGKMPADLLVGEDGYPRAVRVSSDADGTF